MTDIENLKRTILKQREKTNKVTRSSPLNKYVDEIIALRKEAFEYSEIAHALWIHQQVKTDAHVLSKFMIRYNKRISKALTSNTATSTKPAIVANRQQSSSVDGRSTDSASVMGSGAEDHGTGEISNAGQGDREKFISTSTERQNVRKEKDLRRQIFLFIDRAIKPNSLLRENFFSKYGHYPEHYEDDLRFWTENLGAMGS